MTYDKYEGYNICAEEKAHSKRDFKQVGITE